MNTQKFKKGDYVRVVRHEVNVYLYDMNLNSVPHRFTHRGYRRVKILRMLKSGAVEIAVGDYGAIDYVDISHLREIENTK